MPNLGPWEIILILLAILLLFGAKKLPELARSMGRSARIFKSEVNEMKNDDAAQKADTAATAKQRELPSGTNGATNPAQASAEDSFWDRPENQPRRTTN